MTPDSSLQASLLITIARVLSADPGVVSTYQHVPKHVTPGQPLELQAALLKWYEVHPVDHSVPEDVRRLARIALETGNLKAKGLGFVVLHRCNNDFYFLIVCTWRNENEIWQSVWYKDGGAMSEFLEFPRDSACLPTYCVWELVPVWSEQQAWVCFLKSTRDEEAVKRWLQEQYQGQA